MVTGLGVSPSAKGSGQRAPRSRRDLPSERKVERLTLRVLSVNTAARALYERHGDQTEGVLRGEFRLPVGPGGAVVPVDDVLMAKAIAAKRRVPGARERAPCAALPLPHRSRRDCCRR